MATRLGTCSICGGDVMDVDSGEWFSTAPFPPPTCRSCGAVTAASRRDVIPMVPVPAGRRDAGTRTDTAIMEALRTLGVLRTLRARTAVPEPPAVGPLPGLLNPPQPAQPWPPDVNWPDSITRWSLRNIDNLFLEGGECFVLGGRDQPLKVTIR